MQDDLQLSAYDYHLPEKNIAHYPAEKRDHSRLLVLSRGSGRIEHLHFHQIDTLVRPGDLLVLNDTRVVPAKFSLRRQTGGRLKGLYLRELEAGCWEVLLDGARRLQPGESLTIEPESAGAQMEIKTRIEAGRWHVRVNPPHQALPLRAKSSVHMSCSDRVPEAGSGSWMTTRSTEGKWISPNSRPSMCPWGSTKGNLLSKLWPNTSKAAASS